MEYCIVFESGYSYGYDCRSYSKEDLENEVLYAFDKDKDEYAKQLNSYNGDLVALYCSLCAYDMEVYRLNEEIEFAYYDDINGCVIVKDKDNNRYQIFKNGVTKPSDDNKAVEEVVNIIKEFERSCNTELALKEIPDNESYMESL